MLVRYAVLAAGALAVAGFTEAQAQSPFPPAGAELQQQRSSPFPPAGQASPFPPANQQSLGGFAPQQPQQPQQMPPCIEKFISLRQDLEKRFDTVRGIMERKPTASEACSALTKFTQAEVTLIKYVTKESGTCPFPPGLLDNIKASNAKSEGYRQNACKAAAQASRPGRSAEPTLSDAFGPPVVDKGSTRTGGGTLDSLSGNPIAR